ncbi:hypothetical protein BpHYR1_019910 [Brachionus plicatilis]|uniref:Uncharacterized protein n=1 Tax=Brachionus plicatilis TaxID=10195 RepID=A0A3M7PTW1_BRAPC|nr:hypothetical protein BpHYR1_019910 [Brachionus plicatilis]
MDEADTNEGNRCFRTLAKQFMSVRWSSSLIWILVSTYIRSSCKIADSSSSSSDNSSSKPLSDKSFEFLKFCYSRSRLKDLPITWSLKNKHTFLVNQKKFKKEIF